MAEEELKREEEEQEQEPVAPDDLSNVDVSLPPSSDAGTVPSEIQSEESKDEHVEPAVLIDQELLQEKTEQIEELQDQLAKERERLHYLEVRLAELSEELSIQTAKCAQAIQERDQFHNKLKESITKIQQFRDEASEREDKIAYLTEKLELQQRENDQLKELNANLMTKYNSIHENYHLIPLAEKSLGVEPGKLVNDEVRRLHLELKRKDR